MAEQSDYAKYRGKCKEFSTKAVEEDPTLTLVRGHYYDPYWGKQQHWWTVRPDGTIFDPTKDQFPSKGRGNYEPFDGIIICEICGSAKPEEEAYIVGSHPYCSYRCAAVDLM